MALLVVYVVTVVLVRFLVMSRQLALHAETVNMLTLVLCNGLARLRSILMSAKLTELVIWNVAYGLLIPIVLGGLVTGSISEILLDAWASDYTVFRGREFICLAMLVAMVLSRVT